LECGDLSPLSKCGRTQLKALTFMLSGIQRESGDKSPHPKETPQRYWFHIVC
jgi:hypothetical protein